MEKSRRVIIAAFVLMAVGAIVPTMLFNARPEKVVVAALQKLDGDVSFMGAATIGTFMPSSAISAAGGDPHALLLPIVFVGQGGVNLPKGKPPSGKGTFVLVGQGEGGKDLTFDVSALQDGRAFAKLSNLPSAPTSASVVRLVDGKWFAMDARTLASLITRDSPQPAADASNPTGTRPAATWQTLRKELVSPDFFGTPTQLALTEFTTMPVQRFVLPIQPAALVTFSQDLKSLLLGRSLSADELKQVADDMATRSVALEVWINSQSEELAQMRLTVASRDIGAKAGNDANHFSMVIKFTSWGTPIEVTSPADVHPYSEILTAFKKPIK